MPTPKLSKDKMLEALAMVAKHGSVAGAAAAEGIPRERLRKRVNRAIEAGVTLQVAPGPESESVRRGWSPAHDMTHTVPEGFYTKGVSTYYNKKGELTGQWVKTNIDLDRQRELFQLAVQEISSKIPRESPVAGLPVACRDDLLSCYVITDYHLGAMAWGEETGADWDLRIAEDLLVDWFGAAVSVSPNSSRAVLAQLGDFLHFDGLSAVTPTSGHLLDADTRFQKLVRVAIRVLRRVVGCLLAKHETVHIIMAEGNHDIASSAWLRELFAALYEDEPRVTVELRPDPYYCVEFGQTSLFFHHGHKKKLDQLETVFIAKFREVFGRTKFSYAHTGHLHHDIVHETNTMKVEQHRTIAAPDSHASRGGWISGRDAKVITYSREFGEVTRHIVSSQMVAKLRGEPGSQGSHTSSQQVRNANLA